MYCRMIRGVYLRANGEMACYCGPGEEVVLGRLPVDGTPFDFVDEFYRNPGHENVRASMCRGVLPYPAVCLKCIYLEPLQPPNLEGNEKEIEWMHVEATSNCNLDCRFCIPRQERASFREPPHFLPFEVYERTVHSIRDHGMSVKWMYFSGRGEPTLHNRLWEMVGLAKRELDTNFLVNTNGNAPYSDAIVDCGLDKIKIAIDGVDQKTYEHYRRGGKLERLLELTRGIAERKRALGVSTPRIIWQYILFEHTDSPDHLEKIQEMALECGVDELLFKTTFTQQYSEFSLDDIPRIHPRVVTLDIKAMVFPELEDLDARLAACGDGPEALGELLHVAKSIFRAFILGIERKQQYNAYGATDGVGPILSMVRKHGEEFEPLLERLLPCLERIASAYADTDTPQAGAWYADVARQLAGEVGGA